jgi:hypothetical protein
MVGGFQGDVACQEMCQNGIFQMDDLWSTWIIQREKETLLLTAIGFVRWSRCLLEQEILK